MEPKCNLQHHQIRPPPLLPRETQNSGNFLLYHARALNSPALAVLSDIGTEQAKSTTLTAQSTTKLLNYCTTYPNSTLRVVASDMILLVFSDASFLSVSQGHSRAAGYFYLSKIMPTNVITSKPALNSP